VIGQRYGQLSEDALRELFHAHTPMIKRYIRYRIDDADARDEVFQRVWLSFLVYVQQNCVANVRGLLVTMAVRRVVEWYGRSAKCEVASDAIGTCGAADPLVRRESELLVKQLPQSTGDIELRLDLAKALRELAPVSRLVLSLTYIDRLTNRELGVVLGLSQQRVSQIHAKALTQLRKSDHLRDYGRTGDGKV
jgi:RNA polymerase sigma factor (sigma-70 family)